MIAGGSGIRELSTASLPNGPDGEVHDDGEPWASSLWAFRQQLDEAERSAFDDAVLTAMATMSGRNAGYDTAATPSSRKPSWRLAKTRRARWRLLHRPRLARLRACATDQPGKRGVRAKL